MRLNFAGAEAAAAVDGRAVTPDLHARLVDAWLEDGDGRRVGELRAGEPIRLNAILEARRELTTPVFGLHCTNAEGVHVFGLNQTLTLDEGQPQRVDAGETVLISGTIENPLTPGRYFMACWVARDESADDLALQVLELLDFEVSGSAAGAGIVSVQAELSAVKRRSE